MTPEKQRIAIAEACGWKQTDKSWHTPDGGRYARAFSQSNDVVEAFDWTIPDGDILPDYLNDLNDMHEAEKVLTPDRHRAYAHHLLHLCGTLTARPCNLPIGASYHATAAQRAEAFLRTLNLWEEA